MNKITVAVIFGGNSGEHEVSIQSATAIISALNPARYDIIPVKIERDGRWALAPLLLAPEQRASLPAELPELIASSARQKVMMSIDVAFPIVHGTYGEDGCLQGLLEIAGIPYVGAGVLGSALGMDKAVQKKLLRASGIPVVDWRDFQDSEWQARGEAIVLGIEQALGYPCFVKPANLGSSVGISKVIDRQGLLIAIQGAFRYDRKVIVERAVPHAREIECGVLGGDVPETSVLGEIIPSNEFYDYAAKYLDGASRDVIPAALEGTLSSRMRAMAAEVFRILEAHGLARVDFLIAGDTGNVVVNEINTLPGFTPISMFAKLWQKSGIAFPALLDRLIDLAVARGEARKKLVRDFAPVARSTEYV